MIRVRQDGELLSISYRARALGIVGAVCVVLGALFLVLALRSPHDVTLRCRGTSCEMKRIAVLSEESVAITGLHGVDGGEELILHADGGSIEMGPATGRRGTGSYLNAEKEIRSYLANGKKGELDTSILVRGTVRYFGFAGVLFVFGIALGLVYAIGAKTTLDKKDDLVVRWRSRHRGKVSEIEEVFVRNNSIIGKLRDGTELTLVATLGGLKKKAGPPKPRPDLEDAATRIRSFVGV